MQQLNIPLLHLVCNVDLVTAEIPLNYQAMDETCENSQFPLCRLFPGFNSPSDSAFSSFASSSSSTASLPRIVASASSSSSCVSVTPATPSFGKIFRLCVIRGLGYPADFKS